MKPISRHPESSEESPDSFVRHRSLSDRFIVASAVVCCFGILCVPFVTAPVHAFSKQTQIAGAAVFHEKGCEHCHGVDGIGTDRGPDLSGIGKRWKKDRIEKQIREGGGGMPPFGDALQPDEVKNLVDYLAAKRKPSRNTPPAPAPVNLPAGDSGL